VLREQQMLEFAVGQRRRIEQHTRVAESKERSGIIGPMDLLRARIRLGEAQDALNQARVTSQAAMNRLRRALDISLDTEIVLAKPGEPRIDGANLEAEAALNRPEIVQMRAELGEAMRIAGVADKNVLPEVTLRVSAGQATTDPFLVQYLPATQRQWSVFLQTSTDLARTAEKNAARQAALRAQSARIALESKIEEVRRQVREQRLQLDDARVRIALREGQIHQAETRLALAEVKFSHDMASNVDVIEAETELQRAEAILAGARVDFAVGVYQLRAMAGQLLPLT
jgi:adhesin transport system outer membrane protein